MVGIQTHYVVAVHCVSHFPTGISALIYWRKISENALFLHVFVCVYIYIYIYIYVCVCVCVCVWVQKGVFSDIYLILKKKNCLLFGFYLHWTLYHDYFNLIF